MSDNAPIVRCPRPDLVGYLRLETDKELATRVAGALQTSIFYASALELEGLAWDRCKLQRRIVDGSRDDEKRTP